MIIRMRDIRRIAYCSRGARRFFARHNLDWQAFLRNGIEADKLLACNDAMADALVESVRNHGR